jgi:hypothetical protein
LTRILYGFLRNRTELLRTQPVAPFGLLGSRTRTHFGQVQRRCFHSTRKTSGTPRTTGFRNDRTAFRPRGFANTGTRFQRASATTLTPTFNLATRTGGRFFADAGSAACASEAATRATQTRSAVRIERLERQRAARTLRFAGLSR